MKKETIVILNFGGQYCQLIARRVREMNVYCEILPHNASMERIQALQPKGIILSGGPSSAPAEGSPRCEAQVFELGVPVLGICYGMHLINSVHGGRVSPVEHREYGHMTLNTLKSTLLEGMSPVTQCWMSHNDQVLEIPEGFTITGFTDNCKVAAMENAEKGLFCVQFHPEVTHTPEGKQMLRNFVINICGCSGDWTMDSIIDESIRRIREQVKDGRVLLALSGGVDSSVAAALLHKAVGEKLTCVYVDHGFMRKNESQEIVNVFSHDFKMNLIAVDAGQRFLKKLEGVSDPETKRKLIGAEFIRVFEEEAKKIGKVEFLAQGTIYPDVIESGVGNGADVIKSHHNVGGLPDVIDFDDIIEPLRLLFKDEVRQLGRSLGLPLSLVMRQPFPGPGLAIRIIGDITEEKLEIVRDSDAILREEFARTGLNAEVGQFFTVLTGIRSVGVMGDGRTYDYTVAIRAVTTDDFMTADWAKIPYDILALISSRIVNEVRHVNRVVYDITTKPPASIEWE